MRRSDRQQNSGAPLRYIGSKWSLIMTHLHNVVTMGNGLIISSSPFTMPVKARSVSYMQASHRIMNINPLTPTVAIWVRSALSVRVPGCQKVQLTA